MQAITLYRYKRANGGITVSPIKPECEYTEMTRLIADEGKALTNGETVTHCVDTDTEEGWWEIDAPLEEDNPEPEDTEEGWLRIDATAEDTDTTTYDELAQVYREGVNEIDE